MNGLTFAVPSHARSAWEELQQLILATGPTPCAGPNRDDWTGTAAQQDRAAERCWDCPVINACTHYAAVADEREGVWGGRTPAQRTSHRKETP